MGRTIVSAIAGYAVLFAVTFVTFSIAYLTMGADRAFLPGSYDVSVLWIAVSFILGSAAAALGGAVSAAIAKNRKGPIVLAGIVLALGLGMALAVATAPTQGLVERTAGVGNLEAMSRGVQPVWVAFVNPFLGVAGVWLGAGLGRRSNRR